MVYLVFLLVWYIALALLCYYTNRRVLLTPQFGFAVSFIPQTVLALFYVKKWDLEISFTTFLVLAVGAAIFCLVSYWGRKRFVINRNKKKLECKTAAENSLINIEKWKCIAFLAFQILTLLWCCWVLLGAINKSGLAFLSEAIFNYKRSSAYLSVEDRIALPGLLIYARTFCIASGYVWSYVLLYGIVYKHSNNQLLYIFNLISSVLVNIVLGSRNGLIQIIVAMLVQLYFIHGKKNNWSKPIKIKTIVKMIIFGIIFLTLFQSFGNLLGRNSDYEFMHYIAIYLSAPIKNLDIFVTKGDFGAEINNWQTLLYVVNYISTTFGIPEWYHLLDLPFNSVNGYNLGNVCTMYYAFLYDFGLPGVCLFTALMAWLCQSVYKKVMQTSTSPINMSVVIYSFVYFNIVFSFFSNKFYENIFNITFVRMVIFWHLIRFFLLNVKMRKKTGAH